MTHKEGKAIIHYHEGSKTFHLTNGSISYIMKLLPNDQVGQLYFGKAIRDKDDFDNLFEMHHRPMSSYVYEGNNLFSLEHCKQEYPSYGSTDFRHPAVQVRQTNGSLITDLVYTSHDVQQGKPKLQGLPATYCEKDDEATTLTIHLKDKLIGLEVDLLYTIFSNYDAIARSVHFLNAGSQELHLTHAMSLCLDLPDSGSVES